MTYKPPTKVLTRQIPYLALVTQVDPTFERRKHHDVEYPPGPSGRALWADPTKRGAYNDYSNTYPVGQPYGGTDATKVAAKAATVGNAVPGNYKGVDTGGWA